MRELLLETGEMAEEERGLRCQYSILVEEVPVGRFFCESYGVKVYAVDTGESAQVPNITVSAQRIDELVELLIRGKVTPAGLEDVVADWI